MKKVIHTNAIFAHLENFPLLMVANNRQHVRELGLRRVLKYKNTLGKGISDKSFLLLVLNFDANDYYVNKNCSETKITYPPYLVNS